MACAFYHCAASATMVHIWIALVSNHLQVWYPIFMQTECGADIFSFTRLIPGPYQRLWPFFPLNHTPYTTIWCTSLLLLFHHLMHVPPPPYTIIWCTPLLLFLHSNTDQKESPGSSSWRAKEAGRRSSQATRCGMCIIVCVRFYVHSCLVAQVFTHIFVCNWGVRACMCACVVCVQQ